MPSVLGGLAALLALSGCSVTKSSDPLSPTIAGPIAGVTISTPTAIQPSEGAQIASDAQPVILEVNNATSNSVRPASYVFEIATDSGFANDILTKTGVAPGSGGHTNYKLTQMLPSDRTYYWRSKADDGANASSFSDTASFHVYTPVVIQPPTPTSPANGSTVSSVTPQLVLSDSTRTGPAGAIQYLFTVATDAAMTSKVASALVAETAGQTSYTVSATLAYSTPYYWRAQAFDPSHQSTASAIWSFVTPAAPAIAGGGSGGGGSSGGGTGAGAADAINMQAATILNSPRDLGSWAVTTSITALDLRSSGVHVEFSKQGGGDRWPDVTPPGWNGSLQVHARHVFEYRGPMVLFSAHPILVRPLRIGRPAIAVRAELVLRSGALGTDVRASTRRRGIDRLLRV